MTRTNRIELTAAPPTRVARITASLTKRRLSYQRRVINPALRGLPHTDLGPRLQLDAHPASVLRVGHQLSSPGDISLSLQGRLTIGSRVFLGRWSLISCLHEVTIGDDVRFGERVSVHDANHTFEPVGSGHLREQTYVGGAVDIGDRVWLGADVVVLPGVTIGADTVVGAGSVVGRSLPAGVLAAGRPAEIVRTLEGMSPPPEAT